MNDETTRIIIAALPGWFVALYIEPDADNAGELSLEPIVAWEIARTSGEYHTSVHKPSDSRWISHGVMPIMIGGNVDEQGNLWCIKTPDGQFVFPYDQTCSDEQAALKTFDVKQRHKKLACRS